MEPATGCRFMFHGQNLHGTTTGYPAFEQVNLKRHPLSQAEETTPVQYCTVFMQTKRFIQAVRQSNQFLSFVD